MRTLLLAALAFTTLTTAATVPAQAAPHVALDCPMEARGVVTHDGDASWITTTQSSHRRDARIETIGGQPALVCTYLMFGGEYWIYQRPPADFPRCRRLDSGALGFYCLH